MPRYDYKCPRCGKAEEHSFKRAIDAPETVGCECGWDKEKQFPTTNMTFKGDGWTPKHYKNG